MIMGVVLCVIEVGAMDSAKELVSRSSRTVCLSTKATSLTTNKRVEANCPLQTGKNTLVGSMLATFISSHVYKLILSTFKMVLRWISARTIRW